MLACVLAAIFFFSFKLASYCVDTFFPLNIFWDIQHVGSDVSFIPEWEEGFCVCDKTRHLSLLCVWWAGDETS